MNGHRGRHSVVFVALTMYTQEDQYIFWRIPELGWTSIPLKGEGKGRTTPSRLMLGTRTRRTSIIRTRTRRTSIISLMCNTLSYM